MRRVRLRETMMILGALCLSACSIGERAIPPENSLKSTAGFAASNIASIQVSESVFHSSSWLVDTVMHEEMNVCYVKTDVDAQDLFFPKDGETDVKERAYVLHVTTDVPLQKEDGVSFRVQMFYLSHESHYLYFSNTRSHYRSEKPMSDGFIENLKKPASSNVRHLTVYNQAEALSPNFPRSGNYAIGKEFSFKVQIVTDVSFIPYLNQEPLLPNRVDSHVGGFEYYSFQMPSSPSTLILSGDPFLVSRLYAFDEVFSWAKSLNEDSLKGITVEKGHVGTDPSIPPETLYSEDPRDISSFLSFLSQAKLKKANNELVAPGGWYRVVTFHLRNGGAETLTVRNNLVSWRDFSSSQTFTLQGAELPDLQYPSSHS